MSDNPRSKRKKMLSDAVTPLAATLLSDFADVLSTESPFDEKYVERLRTAVLSPGMNACVSACSRILRAGISEADIIDRYIPAVARSLGQDWAEDHITFAATTMGAARLQWLAGEVETAMAQVVNDGLAPGVLVVVPRGEHHTLGAIILSSQLRRRGMCVRLLLDAHPGTFGKHTEDPSFEATLVSTSSKIQMPELRSLVTASRLAMRQGSPVLIGGLIADAHLDLPEASGADHVAKGADEALRLCNLTAGRSARISM